MTTAAAARREPVAGDRIHFLRSGLTFATNDTGNPGTSRTSARGQTVTLTTDMIHASKDRNGATWLNLVDDEAEQVQRWGVRMFASGAFPEGLDTFQKGSPEEAMAREAARMAAFALPTTEARNMALRDVTAKFGIPTTQTSTKRLGN